MNWRKTGRYRYFGRQGKVYAFVYAREHGKWDGFDKYQRWYTARVGVNGKWLYSEGQFTSYLDTLKKAKKWTSGIIRIYKNSHQ